jgi:hypothetical protein
MSLNIVQMNKGILVLPSIGIGQITDKDFPSHLPFLHTRHH